MFYRVVSIIFLAMFLVKCNCKSTGYYTEFGRLRQEESSGSGDVDDEVKKTDFQTWLKVQNDQDDGSGKVSFEDEEVASTTIGPACEEMVDISFALDASDSIGPIGFRMIKSYTKKILGKLDLSHCDNVAIIKFSDFANSETYLGTRDTKANIFARLDALEEPEKLVVTEVNKSRIGLALLVADELVFTSQLGSRSSSKKYLVVMTDGKQPRHDYSNRTLAVEKLVKKLTKRGIQILVLAMGEDPSINELVKLTSQEKFIFPERRLHDLMHVLVPEGRHPNDLSKVAITELDVTKMQKTENENNLENNFNFAN